MKGDGQPSGPEETADNRNLYLHLEYFPNSSYVLGTVLGVEYSTEQNTRTSALLESMFSGPVRNLFICDGAWKQQVGRRALWLSPPFCYYTIPEGSPTPRLLKALTVKRP